MPFIAALILAIGIAAAWIIVPRVWLHNGLLILMLVSMAAVFGVMFSPWTIIVIMLAVSIYDYFAVRHGYMQWMAKKLSETEVLPAFFIPQNLSDWIKRSQEARCRQLFLKKAESRFPCAVEVICSFPPLAASVCSLLLRHDACYIGILTSRHRSCLRHTCLFYEKQSYSRTPTDIYCFTLRPASRPFCTGGLDAVITDAC